MDPTIRTAIFATALLTGLVPSICLAETAASQRFTGTWTGTWPNHGALTIKVRPASATTANVDYTRAEDNGRYTTEPTTTARVKGDSLSFGAITMTLTSTTTATVFGAFPRQPLSTSVTKSNAP